MIEISMPRLGESVTEGTISRWLKSVGEPVAEYEALLEVTTDKVDTEVPAPVSGTVSEILVPAGKTVPVGTLIARLAIPGEAIAPPAVPKDMTLPVSTGEYDKNAAPVIVTSPVTKTSSGPPISPVVARLAAEHSLDLSQITGTGQGGRISKQDVLRYLEQASTTAQTAPQHAEAEVAQPVAAPQPGTPARPVQTIPASDAILSDEIELVPLSPMRRIIAEHMLRSVRETPHVTTVFEIDMLRVAEHRASMRPEFERQGVRLTYMAYILEAVARALHAVPVLNGRYTDAGIILNSSIHLGVAVALDDGLLVPVIRDANEKSLLGLARTLSDLSERARSRRLKPDETQGGTFSITNHGASGSLIGTPIINQPQSAILGVGAIIKRPVVVSQQGSDAIAIRPISYFSLSFDHRVCDGAQADAFMMLIKKQLETYAS